MFATDKETECLVDSRNENKHLKGGSDGSEEEVDEDGGDEEIFSDTDEEYAANQKSRERKAKPVKNLKNVQIKHFKQEIIEPHLCKVNQNFKKYK